MWFVAFRRRPLLRRAACLAALCLLVLTSRLRDRPAAPAAGLPVPAGPLTRAGSPAPRVALTFDLTHGERELAEILEALAGAGVQATFFVSHLWAANHPDRLQALAAAGHEIGTLGLKFTDLRPLEAEEVTVQLTSAQGLLFRVLARPVRLFRPPMGLWDAEVLAAARAAGLLPVTWRVDAGDGVSPPPPARTLAARVVEAAGRGDIIRLHASDFATTTGEALPLILRGLAERGLEPGPVRHLLE